MRSILVLNSKGGSGKSTIAINLAVYYAMLGRAVALVDHDPQHSALDWLAIRPTDRPAISGVDGGSASPRVPRGTDVAIIDAPAATHGKQITELLRKAQSCVVPVVPSILDLNAASRFLNELVEAGQVINSKVRVATVANRVRENSPGRVELEDYLRSVKLRGGRRLPFTAVLRNTQNYVHAAERGLGIFEMPPSRVAHDIELWAPLLRWLNSKRSMPK